MHFFRRYRLGALACSISVLVCSLISKPFVEMGFADDGPYILTVQHLASTGHIAYNGWVSAMLGWQLYLADAFVKLFGFSFTAVRLSALLISMALGYVLQRALVRIGASEVNATIGTLAFVLSPLYLSLSNTFMSDVPGLFATVVCFYGCLRAIQASNDRRAIGWLCFAVLTNAICGTSRQTAWLGILVIVPSALWLLRARRRVLFIGAATTLAGMVFLFGCMSWFRHQPYTIPSTDHLRFQHFPVGKTFSDFAHFFLNFPFLLLPLFAAFLPALRKSRTRVAVILLSGAIGYVLLALLPHGYAFHLPLEPAFPQDFGFNVYGMFDYSQLHGDQPVVFGKSFQVLLTMASLAGLIGLIASFYLSDAPTPLPKGGLSWTQICVLLLPFTIVYLLLILPRPATYGLFERYALPLLFVTVVFLVRWHEERIGPYGQKTSLLLVIVMAVIAVAVVHNSFSFYRARVALAAEIRSSGVPDTTVDNGWEYNFGVELQHSDHINIPEVVVPANAYVFFPPSSPSSCPMIKYDYYPHIKPSYAVSFDRNACFGPAPFAPVQYSVWLGPSPGTLYVVHSQAPVGTSERP